MNCPRCGAETQGAPECPSCGVVVRKARPPLPPRAAQPRPTNGAPAWRSLILPGIGLVALAFAAAVHLSSTDTAPRPLPAKVLPTRTAPVADRNEPPDLTTIPPPVPDPPTLSAGVPESDVAAAARLVARLRAETDLGPDELRSAEDLYSRYPQQAGDLLHAVLLRTALQERRARRYAAAASLLERALAAAEERDIAYATLEVRASNARAMRLYERFGFRPVAIRKRYYADTGEDALVMAKDLPDNGERP